MHRMSYFMIKLYFILKIAFTGILVTTIYRSEEIWSTIGQSIHTIPLLDRFTLFNSHSGCIKGRKKPGDLLHLCSALRSILSMSKASDF